MMLCVQRMLCVFAHCSGTCDCLLQGRSIVLKNCVNLRPLKMQTAFRRTFLALRRQVAILDNVLEQGSTTSTLAQSRLGSQVTQSPQYVIYNFHRGHVRTMCQASLDKEVDDINDLFVTARDEIDFAKEEAETVYFNESVAEAKKAVDACLNKWHALLNRLDADGKSKLQRSMGLKMEQLKAEFDLVASTHLED